MIGRLAVFLVSWSAVADVRPPQVKNELADCIQITVREPQERQNLLLVAAQLTVARPIGACGCKSGGIRYRSYETFRGRLRQMNAGALNSIPRTGKQSEVLLVLNADTEVYRSPPFSLTFSCEE